MQAHRVILTGTALLALAACEGLPDFDLRDLGNGFDTSAAVENLPDRPAPDDRGVISYPNYQVVVAQRDDTIAAISARLGLETAQVASFNGIEPDIKLRAGELVALPSRVSEPSPATGAETTGPITPLNIESIATTALDRVEESQPAAPEVVEQVPAAQPDPGVEPIRHKVVRGDTVFKISRQYNVPVRNIAEWNSLGPDLLVREGQFLFIPQGGAPAPIQPAAQPEAVPEVPVAPVADVVPEVVPVPEVETPAEPESTAAARFVKPLEGPILREFSSSSEGIQIGAPSGTLVRAADSGKIVAVTTDTNGTTIVIIRHDDGLLTVYTNLDNVTVSKDDAVGRGDNIGQVHDGQPSFLNFQVRRGLQALDPKDFLP